MLILLIWKLFNYLFSTWHEPGGESLEKKEPVNPTIFTKLYI